MGQGSQHKGKALETKDCQSSACMAQTSEGLLVCHSNWRQQPVRQAQALLTTTILAAACLLPFCLISSACHLSALEQATVAVSQRLADSHLLALIAEVTLRTSQLTLPSRKSQTNLAKKTLDSFCVLCGKQNKSEAHQLLLVRCQIPAKL